VSGVRCQADPETLKNSSDVITRFLQYSENVSASLSLLTPET
jgi:hypothetical protein